MTTRSPFRANMFYPGSPNTCRMAAQALLDEATLPPDLPARLIGGIVPHAGWVYSGPLAALTCKALAAATEQIDTVILLGADHVGLAAGGAVYAAGAWASPIGELEINESLADALLEADGRFVANELAHAHEHSLEVQLPFIQLLWPGVKLLPIMIEPAPDAADLGSSLGKLLSQRAENVIILGSTDLTHHGGHFPAPGGSGIASARYTESNDQRLLDRMAALDAEGVISEVTEHHNACGAGAIAATLACCRTLGASAGTLLAYDHSYNITHRQDPTTPDDTTVGYASVVFG
jgi:AmmeMemoRadiSam system protein B